MKRMILILLLLCMLCGCGSSEQPEPAVLTDTQPDSQTATEDGLISLQPQVQTTPVIPAPSGPNEAQYSLAESDDSVRNDSGDILVSIRYQLVILDASQPQWEHINDLILADYQSFREEVSYLHETSPQDWEAQLKSMDILYGNLMANRSARVTNNSGGIFSIRMQQEWFMGGVFNTDSYGLNFDLTTGEELPLSRLSDLPEEEFEAQLKATVCEALVEHSDYLFEDPAAVLEDYSLEDFSFCIEEGELVLLFPTYTFGPGVMGSTEIKTGLFPITGH